MGAETKIEWCDATFNPWWGCTAISPGCDHCYAERFAKRLGVGWGTLAARRVFGDKHWNEPRKWNAKAARTHDLWNDSTILERNAIGGPPARPRVFCASMADVFDKDAPDGARERLWALIEATPFLDWLLLTKRIGNVRKMVPEAWDGMPGSGYGFRWPANVWIGISVVNQDEVERDVPKLLALPARVRFLSCEPLLARVDLAPYLDRGTEHMGHHEFQTLDWIIVGGESGPGARAFDVEWARSIVAQCRAAGVACLVKQLGAHVITNGISGPGENWPRSTGLLDTGLGHFRKHLIDKKGGDWNEWPRDLQVREFPR